MTRMCTDGGTTEDTETQVDVFCPLDTQEKNGPTGREIPDLGGYALGGKTVSTDAP